MVMVAAPLAGKLAGPLVKKVASKLTAKKTGKAKPKPGEPGYRRRRVRLLTLGQREELMWVSRHIGRTAAAERMMHYRR